MANISMIGLYDDFSLGLRIMSSLLKSHNHKSDIIFFKKPEYRKVIFSKARPNNYEVFIKGWLHGSMIDVNPWTQNEIRLLTDVLISKCPDIIGISSRSVYNEQIQPILRTIKSLFPNAWLIAGGFGPTLTPQAYLKEVDAVVFGEGEEAIVELAKAKDNGYHFHDIPNILYLHKGTVVENPVSTPTNDLDRLPFPDHHKSNITLIDDNKILAGEQDSNIYSTMAGRGCVGTCTYCSAGQWRFLYKEKGVLIRPRRLRSVENVIQELILAKQSGYKFIKFLDSFLVGPKDWVLHLLNRYREEICLPFYAVFHPTQLIRYPEILDASVHAGLDHTNIAIQHGDEAFCEKYYRRFHSNETLLQVAHNYRKHGIRLVYQLIGANPLDTRETLKRSLDFLKIVPFNPGTDALQVFRLKILPYSPIESILKKEQAKEVERRGWLYNALLYEIRVLLTDTTFKIIFDSRLLSKYPSLLFFIHKIVYLRKTILVLFERYRRKSIDPVIKAP